LASGERARFDAQGFHAALDAVRRNKQLSWRQVADATKVSASTLTRMAQGSQPDASGLTALCKWSGLTAADFLRDADDMTDGDEPDTLTLVTTLLRADHNLDARDRDALEQIVRVAYERFREE
jgi:transcriptional regulator with XRE-family HTH domain